MWIMHWYREGLRMWNEGCGCLCLFMAVPWIHRWSQGSGDEGWRTGMQGCRGGDEGWRARTEGHRAAVRSGAGREDRRRVVRGGMQGCR